MKREVLTVAKDTYTHTRTYTHLSECEYHFTKKSRSGKFCLEQLHGTTKDQYTYPKNKTWLRFKRLNQKNRFDTMMTE